VRPSSVSVAIPGLSFQSRAEAVTHPLCDEEESLSDVRGADARSAQIDRPDGVARSFQVSVYSVEPSKAVLARNLLSKDDWRATLLDETEPGGPEVALVSEPSALARGAERLAGAASGPYGAVVGPPSESQRVAPDADSGEGVELLRAGNIHGIEFHQAPLIDAPRCDMARGDEVPHPRRRKRIDLVVDRRHH
jgi:hypothetical protein